VAVGTSVVAEACMAVVVAPRAEQHPALVTVGRPGIVDMTAARKMVMMGLAVVAS